LVQRVLDIDVDFFVEPVVFQPLPGTRPDPATHSVWPVDSAVAFVRERCGVAGPLPGFVTQNHGEMFVQWERAIEDGRLEPPFHVTHVDAHADLGLGDSGYKYLLSSLMFLPVAERVEALRGGSRHLTDGNFLAFAVACQWIAGVDYVYGAGGGSDLLSLVMEGFDPRADRIRLAAVPARDLGRVARHPAAAAASRADPPVPIRASRWEQYTADGPFDFVCVTRSPPYTPPTADPVFEALVEAFVVDRADGRVRGSVRRRDGSGTASAVRGVRQVPRSRV
jgi:hypothetical protein